MSCTDYTLVITKSDSSAKNSFVNTLFKSKNLYVCDNANIRGSISIATAMMDSNNIPVDPLLIEWIEDAGMRIDPIVMSPAILLEAGVDCGTGSNTILYDGVGHASAPSVSADNIILVGLNSSLTNEGNNVCFGNNVSNTGPNNIIIGNDLVSVHRTRLDVLIGHSIETDGNPVENGNTMIGNNIVFPHRLSARNCVVGHRCVDRSFNPDRNVIIGHNYTNSGRTQASIVLGSDSESGGLISIVLGRQSATNAEDQIIIGSGGTSAPDTTEGRLFFINRESVGAGATIPGTADAYIPIRWNGGLRYIPAFTTLPT